MGQCMGLCGKRERPQGYELVALDDEESTEFGHGTCCTERASRLELRATHGLSALLANSGLT